MSETGEARPRLSALVVARDEEANLPDCLGSLAFCDETVVVLDRCTDGSLTIARGFTERVLEGAWPVEGARRNAGIEACRGDWVLEVDADERVPPALAAEVRRTVETSTAAYHLVPFDNYVGRRLVRYGWGAHFGVRWSPRLCRRGLKRWGAERVHPKLYFAPGTREGRRLEHRMVHYVDRHISDMIRRLDSYSTARALDLRDAGGPGSAFHSYRRMLSRFWTCFVARQGYREGGLGFLIALCAGLYPVLSYLKARHDEP